MTVDKFILWFIPEPSHLESEDLRRRQLLVSISFITVIYALAFIPISFFMGYFTAITLILFTIGLNLLIPFLLRARVPFIFLANAYLLSIAVAEVVLYRTSSGLYGSPTDPEFVAFIPVIALLLAGRQTALIWMIIVIGIIAVFGGLELYGIDFPLEMKADWVRRFVIMTAIGHVLLMLMLVNIFENTNRDIREKLKISYAVIEKEKKIADDLLLNILPEDAANELKEKGFVDARHYSKVTVLFTDFKDFSKIAEKLSPSELVALINRYYHAFDAIVGKHGLEKIKTIGDSYMAAGGLPRSNETNPEDVVRAALEIQEFISTEWKTRPLASFEARIGIHTGPVVAGIVGAKKFAYDIWGDTVNTASRMEQHGESGKINTSEATYECIKDKFRCHYRGEIEAKSKGKMKMYFVEQAT